MIDREQTIAMARLADLLITPYTECNREASAELHRLHEVNKELLYAVQAIADNTQEGGAINKIARAALAKAGEQHD